MQRVVTPPSVSGIVCSNHTSLTIYWPVAQLVVCAELLIPMSYVRIVPGQPYKRNVTMKLTMVPMDSENRMLRPISIGLNKGKWYVRTDWWWVGFRVTKE